MVYITSDGRVLESRPWDFQRLVDTFWGALDFINLFFRSLVGLDQPRIRSRNNGGGSGGSGPGNGGPPRPPRRMGRITTIEDCSVPGGG